MSFLRNITGFLQDPPPEYVFEVSEGGISYLRPGSSREVGFEPLKDDVLSISPLRDNILRPEEFAARVNAAAGPSTKKRRRAVLILPDFSARVAVLDFDNFPEKPEEQMSLVRFRMKKGVPFDIDDAALSYYAQNTGKGKIELVVAAVALEIIARYEAPFRAAGLHTGVVTVSSLATAELEKNNGITLLAKLSGRALTVSVFRDSVVRLVRCVELPEMTADEVMAVVFPTIAFIEDELAAKPDRLTLCGFDGLQDARMDELAQRWQAEFGVPVGQLRSPFGTPGQFNSGILGYIESLYPSGRSRAEAVPA
jgi:type IV pilus assembly protein PilM